MKHGIEYTPGASNDPFSKSHRGSPKTQRRRRSTIFTSGRDSAKAATASAETLKFFTDNSRSADMSAR